MKQAIRQSNTFGGSADSPRPREQSVSLNGDAVRHLLKIGDDFEVQTPTMRGGLLLQPFDQGLRNIFDRQGCHTVILPGGSIMIPLWILAGSSRNGQAGAHLDQDGPPAGLETPAPTKRTSLPGDAASIMEGGITGISEGPDISVESVAMKFQKFLPNSLVILSQGIAWLGFQLRTSNDHCFIVDTTRRIAQ
jgi:hypothetical protein